jgi:hypothetical protein
MFTPQQLIGEERGVLEDDISLSVAAKSSEPATFATNFIDNARIELRHLVSHLACKCIVNYVNVSTPLCCSESSHNF